MSHQWKFFRAGGFDQVRIDTAADLLNLKDLDQKLWVALSCPTRGIEFDARTLELLDSDADGRIRAPELLAAIDWTAGRLATVAVAPIESPMPTAYASTRIDSVNPTTAIESAPSLETKNVSTIANNDSIDISRIIGIAKMMRAAGIEPFVKSRVVPTNASRRIAQKELSTASTGVG